MENGLGIPLVPLAAFGADRDDIFEALDAVGVGARKYYIVFTPKRIYGETTRTYSTPQVRVGSSKIRVK